MNLKDWRKQKGWRQEDLADKLGEPRPTFQSWETGRSAIPPAIQAKLRKMGYDGPWPQEEAKTAEGVTREEFADLKAALKAHVEYWRDGEERVLQKLMELGQRISQLEKRV
jgi:transcriptional regulator with XRE-family HTH domain